MSATITPVIIYSYSGHEETYTVVTPDTYKSPILINTTITFVSMNDLISHSVGGIEGYLDGYIGYIQISDSEGNVLDGIVGTEDNADTITDTALNYTFDALGTYIVSYRILFKISGSYVGYVDVEYTFTVTENVNPLKKWTITSVINRLLDLAEPIRKGETSRFKLNEDQAEKFDNILAPQFAFTKQTLRECLQEIGGVIHGEPRMSIAEDDDGYYYEISFDMYGGMKKWKHANLAYISKTYSQKIDNYCTNIDSAAENLVNALGEAIDGDGNITSGGVITEPYSGGFKTVRCDTLYERITEDNMLISTQLPIYTIEKLECAYNGDFTNYEDITPYVIESSLYNTQLSSYDSSYPYSKAYGIMYTQGSKNITALNFKQDNPISSVFSRYAIVNILREVTGESSLSVDDYPLLAFRITYTPYYSARVGQSKPYYKETPRGAALIYNQQSNVVESRFYGENLKGAAARLGNTDISITYLLAGYNQIPKAGMLFDDDYYISTVECEMLPTCIKCQIGLSKDFNRLSQYIGISSEKRYSEVSQTQATERDILYREYILISEGDDDDEDRYFDNSYIGYQFLYALGVEFSGGSSEYATPLTNVVAWGETGQGSALNVVQLPVIASAFGNSISFGWAYEDNYSAGAKSQYQTGSESGYTSVSGYFENNVEYCDYYGRLYYYHFDLQPHGTEVSDSDDYQTLALHLPEYDGSGTPSSTKCISTEGFEPLVVRKDNREKLQFNFQIDFVTKVKEIIIGSGLAVNHPWVRAVKKSYVGAKLYIFSQKLDKFIHYVNGNYNLDLSNKVGEYDISTLFSASNANYKQYLKVYLDDGVFPAAGKSWAIVTNETEGKEETVEDELGNVSTQTTTYGGEVLLAKNIEFAADDTFEPIYFTRKREIYDKTIWKDKI